MAVRAAVAVAAGFGVATCACARAKKATKPTRTHTLRKAIPDRIRMFTNGTTIRSLRLNYGFTHPETSPSLYRSTDRMRFEARDPPICESLPCSASVNNPTGQINPTFFAPGDNLPANQVVHFNIEVGYTLPNDTTVRKWWSPTQTSPTTRN